MSQPLCPPESIRRRIGALPLKPNAVGRSNARVFQVGSMHLKVGPAGTLERSAVMQDYFHRKGLSSALCEYTRHDGQDWLLTETVQGVPAYDPSLRENMPRLARRLGEIVRSLHETFGEACPYIDVNARALDAYEKEYGRAFEGDTSLLKNDVLVHGDACLPNIFMDRERFYGFVDLGDAGLGDRHFDLYWTAWSMRYNFKTDEYEDDFLDAYGRDVVDADRLELCAQISAPNG